MKTLIQLFAICLLSINAHAATLTAAPVKDLMAAIDATSFKYTETGMAYGFSTIKSCVYTSPDMIVLKNYCSPKKDYPAKGYTIISKKFGYIEFYQEQVDAQTLKRDVSLDGFPENTAPFLKANLSGQKLPAINNFIESYSARYEPACWSTNFSFYTHAADVNCFKTDIAEYPAWSEETQTLLGNEKEWAQLIKTMEAKFPR
ncbi:hypothetical protein CIK05_00395 [Bdellovibrio sp. qaytius]|nr:hypothetical protein CIK05_00395 [Bdellovibrio sp. qaytius]